jgi:hypothetical protein
VLLHCYRHKWNESRIHRKTKIQCIGDEISLCSIHKRMA